MGIRLRCSQKPILHVVDIVSQGDECFAVRDDDNGQLALHRLQGLTDLDFAGHIDLASRLIQNENLRLAQDGSG